MAWPNQGEGRTTALIKRRSTWCENGPCQTNVALPIHLDKPEKELDEATDSADSKQP
jgi:hypothetical protein